MSALSQSAKKHIRAVVREEIDQMLPGIIRRVMDMMVEEVEEPAKPAPQIVTVEPAAASMDVAEEPPPCAVCNKPFYRTLVTMGAGGKAVGMMAACYDHTQTAKDTNHSGMEMWDWPATQRYERMAATGATAPTIVEAVAMGRTGRTTPAPRKVRVPKLAAAKE